MSNIKEKPTPDPIHSHSQEENVHEHNDESAHSHTHSPEEYKKLIHRTSIIIGHAASIKKMLEEERDCAEILIQISAVQSSLTSLGKLILKNHINECLINANKGVDASAQDKALTSLNNAIDKFVG